MARKSKTLTISMPPELYDEVIRLADREHRTQSELIREAVRHYSARYSDLRRILREASDIRNRLGLPPARAWSDEEVAEFLLENELDDEVRARILRELGIK